MNRNMLVIKGVLSLFGCVYVFILKRTEGLEGLNGGRAVRTNGLSVIE